MLHWSVEDDGRGLDLAAGVWQRGNGLAGIKERVWAAGGDLECLPVQPRRRERPGLRLQALLRYAA
jgi:two-component system sensor histidine kinase UhpB